MRPPIRELVFQGRGDGGEHHHVAPIHPEYFALPPMKPRHRAGEGAADGGRPRGRARAQHRLRQHQRAVAAAGLRDPAGPAGAGRDQAQHQPDAGRRSTGRSGTRRRSASPPGRIGRSAPWSCRSATAPACPGTRPSFASKEFDEALDAAEATVDVEQRRAAMEKVEKILQDAAVMVQPLWQPVLHRLQEGAQLSGASDPVSPVQQGLDERLIDTVRPGRPAGPRPIPS